MLGIADEYGPVFATGSPRATPVRKVFPIWPQVRTLVPGGGHSDPGGGGRRRGARPLRQRLRPRPEPPARGQGRRAASRPARDPREREPAPGRPPAAARGPGRRGPAGVLRRVGAGPGPRRGPARPDARVGPRSGLRRGGSRPGAVVLAGADAHRAGRSGRHGEPLRGRGPRRLPGVALRPRPHPARDRAPLSRGVRQGRGHPHRPARSGPRAAGRRAAARPGPPGPGRRRDSAVRVPAHACRRSTRATGGSTSMVTLADVSDRFRVLRERIDTVILGQDAVKEQRARLPARGGPRAPRGRAGHGQDPPGPHPGAPPGLPLPADPVHARPHARRPPGHERLQPEDPGLRVPARAHLRGPAACPTRSTAPRPAPSRRCSSACRRRRPPSTACATRSRRSSPSSPPRTPWSSRAPTPCPRRSATASS